MYTALLTPCSLLYPPNHFCLPTTSSLPSLCWPGGVVGTMPPSRLGWQIFRTVSRGGDNPFPAEGGPAARTPLARSLPLPVAMARDVCCQGEQHRGGAMATASPFPSPLLPRGQRPRSPSPPVAVAMGRTSLPGSCGRHGNTLLSVAMAAAPCASSCSAPLLWQQPRSPSLCPVATATASFPPGPEKGTTGQSPTRGQGREGLGE